MVTFLISSRITIVAKTRRSGSSKGRGELVAILCNFFFSHSNQFLQGDRGCEQVEAHTQSPILCYPAASIPYSHTHTEADIEVKKISRKICMVRHLLLLAAFHTLAGGPIVSVSLPGKGALWKGGVDWHMSGCGLKWW